MYKFEQEDGKYHTISTATGKHVLLVGASQDEINAYCTQKGLIAEKEDNKYIVFEDVRVEPFFLMYGALIRRLAPFKPFDYLYKYFWRTSKLKLVVLARYIHEKEGDECPFLVYNEKRHGTPEQLELPHA